MKNITLRMLVVAGMISTITLSGKAQGFSTFTKADTVAVDAQPAWFPGSAYSNPVFVDVNNDGLLDVFYGGRDVPNGWARVANLSINNGDSTFTKIENCGVELEWKMAIRSLDYNNDGLTDLVVVGENDTKLYKNIGDNKFERVTAAVFANNIRMDGDRYGILSVGDYDHDGLTDILMTGYSNDRVTQIFKNNGDDTFTPVSGPVDGAEFLKASGGSADFGDYNNDGWLDVLVTGYGDTGLAIYQNDKDGSFTKIEAALPFSYGGDATWFDANGDGNLDVFITGEWATKFANLYYGDGQGGFTFAGEPETLGLSRTSESFITSGDMNNDGRLDIVYNGWSQTYGQSTTHVYYQQADGTFVNDANSGIAGTRQGGVAVGDMNNDGALDLFTNGWADNNSNASPAYLYRNELAEGVKANQAPSAPANLTTTISNDTLTMSWDAASDDTTATAALTYNICIKDNVTGKTFMLIPADLATGKLRMTGDAQIALHTTSYQMPISRGTNYTIGVQAIDQSLAGSAFTTKNLALYDFNTFVKADTTNSVSTQPAWLTSSAYSNPVFVDINNDGLLDIFYGGRDVTNGWVNIINLAVNNGDSTFTKVENCGVTADYKFSVRSLDYNNDGLMDLIVVSDGATKLYKNNGDSTFAHVTTAVFPNSIRMDGERCGVVSVGDVDHDGLTDILITGYSNNRVTQLFKNNGDDTFTALAGPVGGAEFKSVSGGSANLGDFNNDGWLDVLVTGYGNGGELAIYKNEKNGTFSMVETTLPGSYGGHCIWLDVNGDGNLDAFITGDGAAKYANIYFGDGTGNFTLAGEPEALGLSRVSESFATSADMNNDGLLDIVYNGWSQSYGQSTTHVYYQQANGSFANNASSGIVGTRQGGVAVGDVNNDGALDLFTTGWADANSNPSPALLYRNELREGVVANVAPTAPANLTTSLSNDTLTLTWDAATDDKTAASALTYNISVKDNETGKTFMLIPADLTSGKLKMTGDAQIALHKTTYSMKVAKGTNYTIGVQAIDQSLAGSAFTTTNLALYGFSKFAKADTTNAATAQPAWFPGSAYSNPVFIDVNNDGLLDVFYGGRDVPNGWARVANLSINNGDSTFTKIENCGVELEWKMAVRALDYNNDGLTDLVIVGENDTKLYKNIGDSKFERVAAAVFADNIRLDGDRYGIISAGDFDNDGLTDILMTGYSNNRVTRIFKNNGDDTFTPVAGPVDGAEFLVASGGSADFGDYNNDGWLDVLVTGYGDTGVAIYQNDKDGSFTKIEAALPFSYGGDATWFDANGDGNLDVFITGEWATKFANLYYGDGQGGFTFAGEPETLGLSRTGESFITSGDMNNDGKLDIVYNGWSQTYGQSTTHVYYQQADGTFVNDANSGIAGTRQGGVAVGDMNNDGALDLFTNGWADNNSNASPAYLYRNELAAGVSANEAPSAPSNFAVTENERVLTLTWNASTDDRTPASAITYNVGIKDNVSGKLFMLIPSDTITGRLKMTGEPQIALHTTSYTMTVPEGDYTLAVQAIDQSLATSNFVATTLVTSHYTKLDNVKSEMNVLVKDGSIFVQSESTESVSVLDLAGKVVKNAMTNENINGLVKGIYFVKVDGMTTKVVL